MKYLIASIILLNLLIIQTGCMSDMAAGINDSSDVNVIPDPEVNSIIPLYKGHYLKLQWNRFDTSGNILLPDTTILNISIPDVYVFENDSTIIPFDYKIHDSTNVPYLFKYEYNNSKEGDFISYLTEDTLIKGIYQYGTYQKDSITLFNSPRLWLKYPGEPNDSWTFLSTDSTFISYELLNTKEPFSIPKSYADDFSPIYTLNCYLYRSSQNSVIQYYYFHPYHGMVGYLKYENGKLSRSAKILSEY